MSESAPVKEVPSRPTVNELVRVLEAAGLVECAGEENARTGLGRPARPARAVRFRAEAGHVVGIDVGPHRLVVLLADLQCAVVGRWRLDDHGLTPARAGREVSERLAELLAAVPESGGLRGIAVATPGLVPSPGTAPPGPWPVAGLLADLRDAHPRCPILVENDANLAVLGEHRRGAARGLDTVAYVHWGSRIGSGLLIHGRLHRGATGAAGELGHLAPSAGPGDPRINASERGWLERQLLDVDLTDPAGRASAVQHLAAGLAALAHLLDPDAVVLGGGAIERAPDLVDDLRARLGRIALSPPALHRSPLRNESAATGAIHLALEAAERSLLP
ncbi:ROK family protein [Kitasatospora sp. CB01950]|uniref:ROK family protein n=1 Tax=Kitasatospora sp. CB01950 TaxID=1703930 RepID=UPI0009F97A21|nr:ROK family protein [Kitasatospora sp. CB01950]